MVNLMLRLTVVVQAALLLLALQNVATPATANFPNLAEANELAHRSLDVSENIFENADALHKRLDLGEDEDDSEYDELKIITVFLPEDQSEDESNELVKRAGPTPCPNNHTRVVKRAVQTDAPYEKRDPTPDPRVTTRFRTKTVTVTKTIYSTVYRRCTQYIKRSTTRRSSSTKSASSRRRTTTSTRRRSTTSTKKRTSTSTRRSSTSTRRSTTSTRRSTTSSKSATSTRRSTTSVKPASSSSSSVRSTTSSRSTSSVRPTTSSRSSSSSVRPSSSTTSSRSSSTTSSRSTSSTPRSTSSSTSSRSSSVAPTSRSSTSTRASSSTTSSRASSSTTSSRSSSSSTSSRASSSTTSSRASSTTSSRASSSTTSSRASSSSTSSRASSSTTSSRASSSTTSSRASSSTTSSRASSATTSSSVRPPVVTSSSTRSSTSTTSSSTSRALSSSSSSTVTRTSSSSTSTATSSSTSTSSSSTSTVPPTPTPKVYNLMANYKADNFYNNHYFFTFKDPTHGLVQFVGQSEASKLGMISTTNGQVYMGYATTRIYPPAPSTTSTSTTSTSTSTSTSATSTASASSSVALSSSSTTSTSAAATSTVAPIPYMKAVRVSSFDTFTTGVFILDASHMPVGCGVWPAWWTVPTNPAGGWPNGGEIDIVEGISYTSQNTYSVHTAPGCKINSTLNSQLGSYQLQNLTQATNCASAETSNQGCGVQSSLRNDFGVGYNNQGGGIHAMLWDKDYGIKSWFFNRANAPADIAAGKPDPTGWGTPQGSWPATDCDPAKFFFNHVSVFSNTICGDWAGDNFLWNNAFQGQSQSCAQRTGYPTCQAYVQSPDVDFSQAYWLINSVKVYQTSRTY